MIQLIPRLPLLESSRLSFSRRRLIYKYIYALKLERKFRRKSGERRRVFRFVSSSSKSYCRARDGLGDRSISIDATHRNEEGVRVRVRVDERVPEKTGGFLVVCTLYVYISWCACNVIE